MTTRRSAWRWGCALVLLVCAQRADAQQGAQDTLQEIGVRADRKRPADARAAHLSPGLKTVVLDSAVLRLYAQQTLATLLAEQSSVFVKSYGFNALATLNFRGASAAQSLVLWNGVPLQNAALGLTDVSLVPVSLVDKVSVLYGASAGLWGSGAVGGAVLLETDPARYGRGYRRLDASVSAGSFGQQSGVVRGDASGEKFALSVRAFGQHAENDFWLPATLFSVAEKQQNARLRGGGFLARGGVKLSATQTLEAHAWVQQYDRQIPRALFESSSAKAQTDRSGRAMLHYARRGRTTVNAKLAALLDELGYDDAAIGLHATNKSRQLFGEVSAHRLFGEGGRGQGMVLAPVHFSKLLRADGTFAVQRRAALVGTGRMDFFPDRRLQAAASARLERIDDRSVFLPGVNASYRIIRPLTIRAALQRTFRAPTLSELHYTPGGNADLRPETGWGGEAGYALQIGVGKNVFFQQEATAYHRHIRDWILWFGGAIWTPHNIAAVQSRGLEVDNRLTISISAKSRIQLSASGAWTDAQTVESAQPGGGSIGKQIPYTPRVIGHASAGLSFRNFFLQYQHAYTGIRYVTSDESYAVPDYHTGNVTGTWDGKVRDHSAAVSVRLANVWGAEYAVIAGRPMPGRHGLLTVRIGLL